MGEWKNMGNTLKAVRSLGTTLVRLELEALVTGNRGVPSKTLELYDSEPDRLSGGRITQTLSG